MIVMFTPNICKVVIINSVVFKSIFPYAEDALLKKSFAADKFDEGFIVESMIFLCWWQILFVDGRFEMLVIDILC